MKKEETTATKGRRTKLSKKSVEELVNIILRKDSVEKALNEKYNALQAKYDETVKNHSSEMNELAANEDERRSTYEQFRNEYDALVDKYNAVMRKNDYLCDSIRNSHNRIYKLTISNIVAYLLVIVSILVIIFS